MSQVVGIAIVDRQSQKPKVKLTIEEKGKSQVGIPLLILKLSEIKELLNVGLKGINVK